MGLLISKLYNYSCHPEIQRLPLPWLQEPLMCHFHKACTRMLDDGNQQPRTLTSTCLTWYAAYKMSNSPVLHHSRILCRWIYFSL